MSTINNMYNPNGEDYLDNLSKDLNAYFGIRKVLGYDVTSEEMYAVSLVMLGFNLKPGLKEKYVGPNYKDPSEREFIDYDEYIRGADHG